MALMAEIRARAPIRLDLAGGWTDVPPFASREGGAVVNLAINRYSYVTVRRRAAGFSLRSADYDARVDAEDLDGLRYDGNLDLLKASVVVAHREWPEGSAVGGLEVFVRCDAPPGSGTGGSGSVGVALAGALAAAGGQRLVPHQAALRAWRAERQEAGVAGGTQDQFAAAYGGANFMEFRDTHVSVSPLRLTPSTVAELEKRLVLCYTGVSRVSGDIIDVVMGAYQSGAPATVAALHALRRLAGVAKTLLLAGDVSGLGELLDEHWHCQKDLHPSVSNTGIDALWE
ncbi:MAG: GHMP kinase, partial [Chloroflexota bacterium]